MDNSSEKPPKNADAVTLAAFAKIMVKIPEHKEELLQLMQRFSALSPEAQRDTLELCALSNALKRGFENRPDDRNSGWNR